MTVTRRPEQSSGRAFAFHPIGYGRLRCTETASGRVYDLSRWNCTCPSGTRIALCIHRLEAQRRRLLQPAPPLTAQEVA